MSDSIGLSHIDHVGLARDKGLGLPEGDPAIALERVDGVGPGS
jgi:hypothetical protein